MAEPLPWAAVAGPVAVGLALSLALEPTVQPRPLPLWRRPLAATVIHVALWLLLFCFELAVFHRPWFAMAIVLAFQLFVVLVNNAKFHSLREPFIFQDFEYFLDALKHPRLYLPFLGKARAVLAVAGFAVAFYGGLHFEPALSAYMPLADFFLTVATLAAFAGALLWCGARRPLPVSFAPQADLRALGLLASLWRYALEERRPHPLPAAGPAAPAPAGGAALPHLVVVQSESFFDARRLFSGIRPEVLQAFDALQASAVCQGRVEVAAWGANTVRTEFSFLSGLGAPALGVHRFNPYRKLARQGVPTLASFLRQQGYRTVCVHPYHASFYTRHAVYPLMGFDEFIDIDSFRDVRKTGPYVGDVALAEKVCALLQQASSQPLFVFVITMENHGPLHLEKVASGDEERLYSSPPPPGCDDLTIYLRHLANADRMAAMLRDQLQSMPHPGWLCWYGDHVPIMPRVYAALGEPDGRTEYFLWGNGAASGAGERVDLRIEELAGLVMAKIAADGPGVKS